MKRLWVDGTNVKHGSQVIRECTDAHQAHYFRLGMAQLLRARGQERQRAAMVEPDDQPGLLAGAVDAAVDTAIMLINENDMASLPPWAQQVCSLVVAADSAIDELLMAMGIPDPDDMPGED